MQYVQQKKVALIDGSYFIYAFANNPQWRIVIDEYFNTIFKQIGTNIYIGFLEVSSTNFRLKIAPEYKGHRKKPPLLYFQDIKTYLIEELKFVVVTGIENDDAMSICAYRLGYDNVVIVSHDKDMRQTPCTHYVLGKSLIYTATEEGEMSYDPQRNKITASGLKLVYAQMLMGDSVDNIQGIPKIGPATTYQLLQGLEGNDLPRVVQREFYNYYGDDWRRWYLKNLILLTMRTHEPTFQTPQFCEYTITDETSLTTLRNDHEDYDDLSDN
jgi:5'-3' exonuclease